MKIYFSFLLLVLISSAGYCQIDKNKAFEFIEYLKDKSVKFEGESINEYLISDINYDGVYEVVERFNKLESEAIGFMNIELNPAFSFDNIFTIMDGRYIESYDNFSWYLTKRLEFYKLWKRIINNPVNLENDSKQLIEANNELLNNELDRLIELTSQKIK